jgi:hypothetical protein
MLTATQLALICTTWVGWDGYASTPELCYTPSDEHHFVYNVEGCTVYHYYLERQTHEILRIAAAQSSRSECRSTSPAEPDVEHDDPVVDDDDNRGKPRGDNSDANGKGGNKHDRDDFTHGGTEEAENKK